MTTVKLLEKNIVQKIGEHPMVMLPLKIWEELEERLEDLAMLESKNLAKKIARARVEKKLYSAAQVKKILGL